VIRGQAPVKHWLDSLATIIPDPAIPQ